MEQKLTGLKAIINLIANAQTEKAIQSLGEICQSRSEYLRIHALISARFHKLLEEELKGTMDADKKQRMLNKINEDILNFLSWIEKKEDERIDVNVWAKFHSAIFKCNRRNQKALLKNISAYLIQTRGNGPFSPTIIVTHGRREDAPEYLIQNYIDELRANHKERKFLVYPSKLFDPNNQEIHIEFNHSLGQEGLFLATCDYLKEGHTLESAYQITNKISAEVLVVSINLDCSSCDWNLKSKKLFKWYIHDFWQVGKQRYNMPILLFVNVVERNRVRQKIFSKEKRVLAFLNSLWKDNKGIKKYYKQMDQFSLIHKSDIQGILSKLGLMVSDEEIPSETDLTQVKFWVREKIISNYQKQ